MKVLLDRWAPARVNDLGQAELSAKRLSPDRNRTSACRRAQISGPAAFFLAFWFSQAALASNCPGYTYTLTNGQTADANQVMANFNTVLNCANTLVPPSQLANYAPLASPAFTGTPTAPTQATGDDSTALATDQFVQNSLINNGLQSSGQVLISSSLTLNSSQAGHNLLISGSGITITFPTLAVTYWLNNTGSSPVTLAFVTGTDFRTTLNPGEQVGLAGDGGGFFRVVAEGAPLYGVTQATGDNSTKLATTAFTHTVRPTVYVEYSCVPSTCTPNAGSGVASVTYNSVGNYTVNFTTAFASANYVMTVSSNAQVAYLTAQAAGSIIVNLGMVGTGVSAVDGKFYLIGY